MKQELTWQLISKYEELRTGQWPTGVRKHVRAKKATKGAKATLSSKQELFAIKNSMYRLKETEEHDALVCPCPANPFNIQCRVCTSFAHDGICKHCLALTHMLMARDDRKDERDPKCNIRLMSMRLSQRQKAGQPAKATNPLLRGLCSSGRAAAPTEARAVDQLRSAATWSEGRECSGRRPH